MITFETARQLTRSLPQVEEEPHFGKPSFRVKKKIFAVLHPSQKRAVLKLSPTDQSVFSDYNYAVFHPVAGRRWNWGP